MRDDFSEDVKRRVAARVGYHCSNPRCRKLTSGPAQEPDRVLNIGVAAHITAAAAGGPRFDPSLSPAQRASLDNAIWLCQSCSTIIDRDLDQFTTERLREWRRQAEREAAIRLAAGTEFRAIAPSEIRHELTIGELAVIHALAEEFGCDVTPNVRIPTGEGWIHLHAAVVRGEDLVAIEIRENRGYEIPYFQIEYLIELGTTRAFERFQKFVLYVAVVSSASPEQDIVVKEKLERMAESAGCEMHIRMYRLNTLRAKYGL